MIGMKRAHWILTGVAAIGMSLCTAALAQDQGGGPPPGGNGGGGGGGGGGRGNWDPAQMRENMLNRLKESMQANDDEWNVIKPKVEKVMDAQRDVGTGGGMRGLFGGGRGGNRGGGGFGGNNDSAVSKARQALQDLLQNNSASNDDIAAKVTAYREARDKAKESLTTAQKDLKEVLSPRQEATLVGYGMLD